MKRSIKKMLGGVALALAAVLCIQNAQARSIDAWSGKSTNPAQQSCISEWYGTATNNCGVDVNYYHIPLAVDAPGAYTIGVAAYGASPASNVGCQGVGIDWAATQYSAGPMVYLTVFGSSQIIVSSGAFVPDGGSLYASCTIQNGGRVNSVNW